MPRLTPVLAALAALALLSACGGPRGDWRAEVGLPSPNARLAEPRPPLAIPPTLELPAPL